MELSQRDAAAGYTVKLPLNIVRRFQTQVIEGVISEHGSPLSTATANTRERTETVIQLSIIPKDIKGANIKALESVSFLLPPVSVLP